METESHGMYRMIVSRADASHVGDVVEMLEATRLRYQEYQPVFWRKAPDSANSTKEFFLSAVDETGTLFLIAADKGELLGFLIAREIPTPPVYAPGGRTYLIDDFCVASSDHWISVGTLLLVDACSQLKEAEASQIVVVCGDRDIPKAELLRRQGLTIASNWWTSPLT